MSRDIIITPETDLTGSGLPTIEFNGLSAELVTLEVQDDGSVQ